MMADFRALCAELTEKLDELNCLYKVPSQSALIERARAALADEPAAPAPPADGEVAELVAALQSQAIQCTCDQLTSGDLRRAAELLQRQALVPVSVSERLPGPKDCDAEGKCWIHQPCKACPESPAWELMPAKYAIPAYGVVCWLPAHALPLPEVGE